MNLQIVYLDDVPSVQAGEGEELGVEGFEDVRLNLFRHPQDFEDLPHQSRHSKQNNQNNQNKKYWNEK